LVVKALQSSSSTAVPEQSRDTDADDLCRILCALGVCPPGCPTENNPPVPPWGGKKRR